MGGRPFDAELRCTLGRAAALQGDYEVAERNLLLAADLLDEAGKRSLGSLALDEIGTLRLSQGDLVGAEAALSAAFRRQRLFGDANIAYTCLRLSLLRL